MMLLSGILLGLAALLAMGFVVYLARKYGRPKEPARCGICNALIRRKKFRWTMPSGEQVLACANCTRNLEAKQSKDAVAAFLRENGKE